MAKSFSKPTTTESQAAQPKEQLPFQRMNYILLGVGAAILFLGFFLLSLDKEFIDATQFSIALHVAPIVIMLGFAEIVFAIMYRPKQ